MKRDVMCEPTPANRIGALIQRLRPTRPKDLEILVKVCGDNMKPTKMAGSAPCASGDAARSTSGRDGRATMRRFRIAELRLAERASSARGRGSTGFSDTGSSIEQHRIDGRSRLRSRFVTRWPKNSPPHHFYPPPTSCRHPVCPWTHPSARSAARRRRTPTNWTTSR